MRRQALLLPLMLLVAGCSGGASSQTEQMYSFAAAAHCFRAAGFQVADTEMSPKQPEVAHDVQVYGTTGPQSDRTVFLTFFKSVALAKEHEAHAPPLEFPPLEFPPGTQLPKLSDEQRGNVIVFWFTGGPPGSPFKSIGRPLLARCLPEK